MGREFVGRSATGGGENKAFDVHCGDYMYADVYANTMYVQDYTNGHYSSQTYGPTTSQESWECITEKNNSTNPLANFGTMTFTGCDGLNAADYYWYTLIGSGNAKRYVPVNASGQNLMNPSGLSNGDTFSIQWLRGS